jgi:hypothetical protein
MTFKASALFLLLIFNFIGLDTNAQSAETRKIGGWYIRSSLAPEMAGVFLRNNEGTEQIKDLINLRRETETLKPAFSSSLLLGLRLNNNYSLELGLSYLNKGFRTKKSEFRMSTIDPNRGFVQPTEPDPDIDGTITHSRLIDEFQYWGLPLLVRHSDTKEKLSLSWKAGVFLEYLVSGKQTAKLYEHSRVLKESTSLGPFLGLQNFSLSPTFGIGIDYHLNTRNSFSIMPDVRFGLLGINENPIVNHLYNVGLEMSWIYRL